MDSKKSSDPAAALVRSGAALSRMSEQAMETVAIQRPRVLAEVKQKVLAEVKAFPEYADRYFYSLPRRTKKCNHPTSQTCPTCSFVEGPSIHCAFALQRYFGNCWSEWSIDYETDTHIYVKGVFRDFESNTGYGRSIRVSKRLKSRDGKVRELYEDELTLAVNAGGSKAQRNAILAGVPDPLKTALWQSAKTLVVGDKPDQRLTPQQIEAVGREFGKWDVSLEMLERKLGKASGEWTAEDRATLIGIRNALTEGEAKEELFGMHIKKTQAKPVVVAKSEPEPVNEPEENVAAEDLFDEEF